MQHIVVVFLMEVYSWKTCKISEEKHIGIPLNEALQKEKNIQKQNIMRNSRKSIGNPLNVGPMGAV